MSAGVRALYAKLGLTYLETPPDYACGSCDVCRKVERGPSPSSYGDAQRAGMARLESERQQAQDELQSNAPGKPSSGKPILAWTRVAV